MNAWKHISHLYFRVSWKNMHEAFWACVIVTAVRWNSDASRNSSRTSVENKSISYMTDRPTDVLVWLRYEGPAQQQSPNEENEGNGWKWIKKHE